MALAPEKLDDLERRIFEQIRAFDAVALRLLLEELGYDRAHIRYRAQYTAAPEPTLLAAIDFQRPDELPALFAGLRSQLDLLRLDLRDRRPDDVTVTVTVNLGLLSNRSPLPSYFEELLADPDYQGPLTAMIDLLDASLIRDRLESFRPERVATFLPEGWGAAKRDWLRLTSVVTPGTLHWMFQQIFPELEVSVRRVPLRRALRAPSVRLGDPRSRMGTAAFGGEAEVTVYGLEVTLLADEAVTDTGDPWAVEARRRTVEQAFPILAEAAVSLTVVLLSREPPADAQFNDVSHATYIGYNPLRDARPDARPDGPDDDAPHPPGGGSPRVAVEGRALERRRPAERRGDADDADDADERAWA